MNGEVGCGHIEVHPDGTILICTKDPTVSDAPQIKERIAKIRSEHFPAHVRITTDFDAIVSVDGIDRGGPGALELPPGKHRITARASAREPNTQDVELRGDEDRVVELLLRKAPTPPKVDRRGGRR